MGCCGLSIWLTWVSEGVFPLRGLVVWSLGVEYGTAGSQKEDLLGQLHHLVLFWVWHGFNMLVHRITDFLCYNFTMHFVIVPQPSLANQHHTL